MQYGAGGGCDGLLFAGADGAGNDAALWGSVSAASGESVVAAWRGVEFAAGTADSTCATNDFANRSGFDSAGHALFT